MKKISIKYTILLSIVLSLSFAAIIIYFGKGFQEVPKYSSSSIINRISQIEELSLVEYHYTSVIGLKSNKSFQDIPLPFTKKFFLATYDGIIKAGVDLSKAKIEMKEDRVHIALPKAKITSHSVNEKSLVVYDESKNILNPIKIEDFNKAIADEKTSMEKKAVSNGILKQAEDRSIQLIQSILSDLKFDEITIEIKNTM